MFRFLSRTSGLFILLVMCPLVLPPSTSADEPGKKDDKAAVVRKLGLEGLRQEALAGNPNNPTEIADVEGLARVFPDEVLQGRLKKEADFKTQKLLFFAWSSRAGDKLEYKVAKGNKGPEVVFLYEQGQGKSLQHHFYLFAIPKEAAWRLEAK